MNNMNAMQTYNSNNDMLNQSTLQRGMGAGGCYNHYDYWQPYIQYYCPTTYYPIWIDKKSQIELAFNILQKLMEKKLVKIEKVGQFIETVTDIASIL